jgi:hypothetical protein
MRRRSRGVVRNARWLSFRLIESGGGCYAPGVIIWGGLRVIALLRSTWILLGALALGVALACGGDTQEAAPAAKALESASAQKLPPPPSSPPIYTTELPADFPADVPLYPGAEVVQSSISMDEGTTVTLVVEDDVEKVASFYADSLAAAGWSTDIKTAPDGSAIFADKTERRVGARVRSTDEGTRIELIIVRVP